MRARITKIAVLSQRTQTTYAPDLTAPIHTGPSKKPPPLSRWARLWERARKLLRLRKAQVPAAVEEGWEGTLVEFRSWEGTGDARRVVYNPFPTDPNTVVEYERPVVLLLDSERVGDRSRVWFTSAVSMIYCDADGLPVRFDTRSSSYAIRWLDKPERMPLPEDDGRVRG